MPGPGWAHTLPASSRLAQLIRKLRVDFMIVSARMQANADTPRRDLRGIAGVLEKSVLSNSRRVPPVRKPRCWALGLGLGVLLVLDWLGRLFADGRDGL